MVPFSLERHKAHFCQVRDCQELLGNTYQIHWVQPNSIMAEIPAYVKVTHTRKSWQTEGTRKTKWIKKRRVGCTLDGRVSRATIAKQRKQIKGSNHTKKHKLRCSDLGKEGRTTQTVRQGRTIATPDKTTKCTSTQEIEYHSTVVMGVGIKEEFLPMDDERRNQKM